MHGYKHIFAQFDIEIEFSHFFYHNMNIVHMVRNYSFMGNYIIQTQLYKKKDLIIPSTWFLTNYLVH